MIVLCLGAFLRIYKLGTIPGGFFRDEAWNGYEAFSLLKAGSDSRGNSFPLFFTQYGDIHFSSIYIYASIFFICTFGLNAFAVRLPAAVFGILTIWMTYLCVKEFLGKPIALITALLVAVSPWHIQFSRLAFRAITLPFFFLLAVYLLKKGLTDKKYIYWGGAALGITMYTYSSANLFVPLFLPGFLLIYGRTLYKRKKETVSELLIFAVIAFPVISHGLTPEGRKHFKGGTYIGDRFHVRDIEQFLVRKIGYFSPAFLFVSGQADSPWPSPWKFGQLYFFEFPLILIGLYVFISRRTKEHILFLFWLFIYPVTAALTDAYFHSLRTITVIPIFQVLAAQGAYSLFRFIRDRPKKWFVPGYAFCVLALFNIGYFARSYLIKYPQNSAPALQYGYRDAIDFIESIRTEDDIIKVSDRLSLSYIFILFYTKYDPAEYMNAPFHLSTFGSKYPAYGRIGNYFFSPQSSAEKDNFTGRHFSLSKPRRREHWSVLKTIHYPDGNPALQVLENIAL